MVQITYLKTDGGCARIAEYRIDRQGEESFLEQPCDDTEWTTFVPSEEEHDVLRQILQELGKENGARTLHFEGARLRIDWMR